MTTTDRFVDRLRAIGDLVLIALGTTASPTGDGNADANAVDAGGIHPTSTGARSVARRARSLVAPLLGQPG